MLQYLATIAKQYYPLFIILAIILVVLSFGIYKATATLRHKSTRNNHTKDKRQRIVCRVNKQKSTYVKKCLITQAEKNFYNKLLRATYKYDVIVQPQVNLASVIDKQYAKYRNELFRNIDFGIFDKNYNLLVLIEYNDHTHYQSGRKYRDIQVKQICDLAGIPLLSFWTHFENKPEYLESRIKEYLEKAA